jgi:putative ABC transport system permease protein
MFIINMAWRDSRRNRGRLLLFVSSIIVGIAALVAINTFSENLQHDIDSQAKTLLGADMVLESNLKPLSDSLRVITDSMGGEQASVLAFLSMAYFPKNEGFRGVQVKAVRGNYPFYGTILTSPVNAMLLLQTGKNALLDKSLMLQFNLVVGDSVKVGDYTYRVAGQVLSASGRSGFTANIAPAIYLGRSELDSVGLLQKGSRVEYNYYFRWADGVVNTGALKKRIKPRMEHEKMRVETVADRKSNTGDSFNNVTSFLNLVGFIALLLGCIGVASAVNIYIKDKMSTVAVLRTLGASGRQAFLIFLTQIVVMGFLGSLAGVVIGTLVQKAIPFMLKDFLPVSDVTTDISWASIALGMISGLGMAVLFSLLPLLAVRNVSPLRTLRAGFEEGNLGSSLKKKPWWKPRTASNQPLTNGDLYRWLVILGIVVFIFGFTWFETRSIITAFAFMFGVGFALALLAGVAKLLMVLVRKYLPKGSSYVFRQSVSNLHRPNNQTTVLIVSIGLGTMLLSTLMLIQSNLLKQVSFAGSGAQSNMVLFDIQSKDLDSVQHLVRKAGMNVMQSVPIVNLTMEAFEGVSTQELLKNTKKNREWFNREYRVTYRDTLIDSEKLVKGVLPAKGRLPDGSIGVTLADRMAEDLGADIGTKMSFALAGTNLDVTVVGIRKVDFARVQTNFLVLFPSGVMEQAPQFHVIVTRVNSEEQSAKFQLSLVKKYSGVSVVDLTQVLKTLDEVLTKVSFVIRFMALFSILTGLMVLISSVFLSKYQRIKESVLLRTLGGSRKQILSINALEYLWLGLLASFTGVVLSCIGVWCMAKFLFQIPFRADWSALIGMPMLVTGLVVFIGWWNSRSVVNESPLAVLRES